MVGVWCGSFGVAAGQVEMLWFAFFSFDLPLLSFPFLFVFFSFPFLLFSFRFFSFVFCIAFILYALAFRAPVFVRFRGVVFFFLNKRGGGFCLVNK